MVAMASVGVAMSKQTGPDLGWGPFLIVVRTMLLDLSLLLRDL